MRDHLGKTWQLIVIQTLLPARPHLDLLGSVTLLLAHAVAPDKKDTMEMQAGGKKLNWNKITHSHAIVDEIRLSHAWAWL